MTEFQIFLKAMENWKHKTTDMRQDTLKWETAIRVVTFVLGFINYRKGVAPRKRFQIFKITGKFKRMRANMLSTINVNVVNIHFLLKRMIRKSMRAKSGRERFSEESRWEPVISQ